MFTKRKKVGVARQVRDIHVTKKVTDWQAVAAAAGFAFWIAVFLAHMGG